MKRICKSYDPHFKAQVALEAIEGQKEMIELSTKHNISKTTINEWKEKLIQEAVDIFKPHHERNKQIKCLKDNIEDLHKIIGEVTIENSFLKKKLQR